MAEAYHELANVSEVPDAGALTIPRAKALFDAVTSQRDYAVVQLLQHSPGGVPTLECLIVEVECDGVPPKNAYGINYRERLALCVPGNPKQLIEVLALRKDFPILMHENQGVPDAPANLCLYFEPVATVLRTWTPSSGAFCGEFNGGSRKAPRANCIPQTSPSSICSLPPNTNSFCHGIWRNFVRASHTDS